jgi:hypothetical protein
MHDFFFGYAGGRNRNYGLLGRQIALLCAPDLHLVDAIWVAYERNASGDAIRQDVLLASRDPFAVDWYASEYALLALAGSHDASAARAGTFRNATRINQNGAQWVWPGGSEGYPYIDLLDDADGSTPPEAERAQMNVYVTSPGAPLLALLSPNGSEEWQTGNRYPIEWTWTGTITEVSLSYSTDGFTAISHTILVSTPNTGIYTWTTPITPSNGVRVRVADALRSAIYDDSDAGLSLVDARYPVYLPFTVSDRD